MDHSQQSPRVIPASRRRDKPIMSCNLCRRRKLKCDRQKPCQTCLERGLSLSCTYSHAPAAPKATPNAGPTKAPTVHERIEQLEKLVEALAQEKCRMLAASATSSSQEQIQSANDRLAALTEPLERLNLEQGEVSYTSSDWTSILDGVCPPHRLSSRRPY